MNSGLQTRFGGLLFYIKRGDDMAKSQVQKNREYRARLTDEERRDLNNRKRYSAAKSYIKLHATNEQLKEVKQIVDDRLKPWATINTKREPRH